MTVREYAILYLDGRVVEGGSIGLGGTVVLSTSQHRLDGPEHLEALDSTDFDASDVHHGLMAKLSGDPDDVWHGDGSWSPSSGSIVVLDDGTPLATDATSIDFVGAGVVASGATGAKTITISEPDAAVVAAGLVSHLGDATDAHDASAISVLDTGAHFTATDVEAALAELAVAGGSLTVEEADGSPTSAVTKIVFPNDTVSIAAGVATVRAVPTGLIGARVTNSGSVAIPNGAVTIVTWDTETWDPDGLHSTSSNTGRITVGAGMSGKWAFVAALQWAANGTGIRWVALYKNGALYQVLPPTIAGSTGVALDAAQGQGGVAVADAVAGDYFEVKVYQDSGGSLNVTTIDGGSSFAGYRLDSGSAGPRGELGYAAINASVTVPKTQTAAADVAGLSVTVTVGSRPIKVTAYTELFDSLDSGKRAFLSIRDDTAGALVQTGVAYNGTAGNAGSVCAVVRVNPGAGSRTYKVQAAVEAGSATDGRVFASATAPAFLLVEEL